MPRITLLSFYKLKTYSLDLVNYTLFYIDDCLKGANSIQEAAVDHELQQH